MLLLTLALYYWSSLLLAIVITHSKQDTNQQRRYQQPVVWFYHDDTRLYHEDTRQPSSNDDFRPVGVHHDFPYEFVQTEIDSLFPSQQRPLCFWTVAGTGYARGSSAWCTLPCYFVGDHLKSNARSLRYRFAPFSKMCEKANKLCIHILTQKMVKLSRGSWL